MTTERLLAEMVERLGGAERLRQIRTLRCRGAIRIGELAGSYVLDREPGGNRYRSAIDLKAFRQTSGFDGMQVWVLDTNGKLSKNSDSDAIAESILNEKFELDHYLVAPDEYELTHSESDGEYVVVVTSREFRHRPFATIKLYVDRESMLIRRKESTQAGESMLMYIEDYASFGDLLWPSLVRTLDPAGNETILQLEDVAINPEFDAPALFEPPADDVRDFEFLNGSDQAIIPIRIPVDHPFATVRIGGNSYQFVVDTGAGSTVLSSAVAEELQLESLGAIRGQGVSGSQEVSFVAVPEFLIGDVAVRGQQVVAMDFSNIRNRLPEMDGLLGMDFLNRFVVKFDYVRGEMTVFERESFDYRGKGEQFSLDGIAFSMSVDGNSGKFRIDTGAPNVGLHSPFVRRLGMIRDRDAMPMTSVISGVGSVELRSFHALCHEIRIGGFTLRDVPVALSEIETGAFANESILGNIGGVIWRKFISYFDFSAGRMILEPNSNFDDPFPLSKFGAGLKRTDGRYYVDSVTTNSPAAELGLQRDDELLEFDGMQASSFRLDELQLKFRAPEGTRCLLKIRTPAGDERNLEALLRNYHRYYDSY